MWEALFIGVETVFMFKGHIGSYFRLTGCTPKVFSLLTTQSKV